MANYGHRVVKTKWAKNKEISFLTGLKITGLDDVGVIHKITNLISGEMKINISALTVEAREGIFMGNMGGAAMDMDQPWVNDYIERMMKDRKYVEDSYHRIQTDKVFAWAETQVNPTEKPISLEAFNKLQEEHQHHH